MTRFGLGRSPLRAMMLTTALMWSVGIVFTLRENLWLTVPGMAVFVAVMPVSEAAEHTVLQRGAVFILASTVGLVMTLVAMRSRPYRRMSDAYAAAAPPAESRQDAVGSGFAVGPLNHPPGLVG